MNDTEASPTRNARTPIFSGRMVTAAGLSAVLFAAVFSLVQWGGLDAPRSETFQFSRGVSFASGEEARLAAFLAEAAANDRAALVITGHSGQQGDASANLALSASRADAVAAMAQSSGVPEGAIFATGVGSGGAFAQPDGVSERAYEASLARVDVTIKTQR